MLNLNLIEMNINPFYEKISRLTDEELVKIVEIEPYNFNTQAFEAAKEEIKIRGINKKTISQIRKDHILNSIKQNEIKKEQKKLRWLKYVLLFIPYSHIYSFIIEAFIDKKIKEKINAKDFE
jgi:hypothetical protein